ncbi:substrate-binding domain-containing protein [Rothia nasimurium]|uniref:substrate-binding domain-containing protein n=1 Tax=Rothia nasimurium TaxID=85336 RepID=UPI003BA1F0D7
MKRPPFIHRGIVAVAATATLILTACGGPAGVNGELKNKGNSSSVAAGTVDTPALKVAFITHSSSGDTFWDIARKGAETAAAKNNIELLYNADPDGSRQAQLVEQAVDQGVDGIVVTLAKPDALAGALAKAKDAGIPVFTINSGEAESATVGALAHFGQNESVAGEAAGEALNESGAKRVICVIHEQGNVGHESRCEGVQKTFTGQYEVLYVQAADMTNVASTITSKLQTNADIDAILTLGAPYAMTAIDSASDAGSTATVSTFDLSADAIGALQDGKLGFIVDQQPYLQGYSAVDGIWLYKTNGNVLGGGQAVLTGPQIITSENAAAVAEYAANGTR